MTSIEEKMKVMAETQAALKDLNKRIARREKMEKIDDALLMTFCILAKWFLILVLGSIFLGMIISVITAF